MGVLPSFWVMLILKTKSRGNLFFVLILSADRDSSRRWPQSGATEQMPTDNQRFERE